MSNKLDLHSPLETSKEAKKWLKNVWLATLAVLGLAGCGPSWWPTPPNPGPEPQPETFTPWKIRYMDVALTNGISTLDMSTLNVWADEIPVLVLTSGEKNQPKADFWEVLTKNNFSVNWTTPFNGTLTPDSRYIKSSSEVISKPLIEISNLPSMQNIDTSWFPTKIDLPIENYSSQSLNNPDNLWAKISQSLSKAQYLESQNKQINWDSIRKQSKNLSQSSLTPQAIVVSSFNLIGAVWNPSQNIQIPIYSDYNLAPNQLDSLKQIVFNALATQLKINDDLNLENPMPVIVTDKIGRNMAYYSSWIVYISKLSMDNITDIERMSSLLNHELAHHMQELYYKKYNTPYASSAKLESHAEWNSYLINKDNQWKSGQSDEEISKDPIDYMKSDFSGYWNKWANYANLVEQYLRKTAKDPISWNKDVRNAILSTDSMTGAMEKLWVPYKDIVCSEIFDDVVVANEIQLVNWWEKLNCESDILNLKNSSTFSKINADWYWNFSKDWSVQISLLNPADKTININIADPTNKNQSARVYVMPKWLAWAIFNKNF